MKNEKLKAKLLLHTCCAPCFTSVFEQLKNDFDVTIFWFNSNIYPQEEYGKRLVEVERYARIVGVKVINIENYKVESYSWNQLVKNYANEPEGGKRCRLCIRYRLLSTAKYAKENGFDFFATTLSVSPYKNTEMINEVGKGIEKDINSNVTHCSAPSLRKVVRQPADATKLNQQIDVSHSYASIQKIAALQDNIARNDKVEFLDRDFKKNDGYKRSIELCKEFNIYRQKYCGCQYSTKNF